MGKLDDGQAIQESRNKRKKKTLPKKKKTRNGSTFNQHHRLIYATQHVPTVTAKFERRAQVNLTGMNFNSDNSTNSQL